MEFGNREKLRIRHVIRTFQNWLNLGFCERVSKGLRRCVSVVLSMGFVFTNDFALFHRVRFRSVFQKYSGVIIIRTGVRPVARRPGRSIHPAEICSSVKMKFQSSVRSKRETVRGGLPGERGWKAQGIQSWKVVEESRNRERLTMKHRYYKTIYFGIMPFTGVFSRVVCWYQFFSKLFLSYW